MVRYYPLCPLISIVLWSPPLQYVMCSGLWCHVDGEKDCKTKLDPPMDGTECDTGKVGRYDDCHLTVALHHFTETPGCRPTHL